MVSKYLILRLCLYILICFLFLTADQTISSNQAEVLSLANLISKDIPENGIINPTDLSKQILELSREYQIDPLIILSVIKVESHFDPQAKSHAGAIGLMQVMPIVIDEIGEEINITNKKDLWNPKKNLKLGVHYLSYLLDMFDNNVPRALAAYNIGPTALNMRLARKSHIPSHYYRKVLRNYVKYQQYQSFLLNAS